MPKKRTMAVSDSLTRLATRIGSDGALCTHRSYRTGHVRGPMPTARAMTRGNILAWDAHSTLPSAMVIQVIDARQVGDDEWHVDDIGGEWTYVFRAPRDKDERKLVDEWDEHVGEFEEEFSSRLKEGIDTFRADQRLAVSLPKTRFIYSRWYEILADSGVTPAGVVFPTGNGFQFSGLSGFTELAAVMDDRLQYSGLSDQAALRELIMRSGRNTAIAEPQYVEGYAFGDAVERALDLLAADVYTDTGRGAIP